MPFIPFALTVGTALGVSEAVGGTIIAGTAAALAGTGIAAYGSYQQGQAQEAQANYQAAVAVRQADMSQRAADQNIHATQAQAAEDSKELNRKYAILEGAQRAAFGAEIGGGSVTEGDVATDTFTKRKYDEANIRYNADLKSWAIKEGSMGEQWGLKTQADQYTYSGKNSRKAGIISGTGTIFSGVGNATSNIAAIKARA